MIHKSDTVVSYFGYWPDFCDGKISSFSYGSGLLQLGISYFDADRSIGGWQFGAMFVAGVLVGSISRDAVWYSLTVKNWPLSKEITNWARVAELIAERNSNAT
jgi:hypothetical protein